MMNLIGFVYEVDTVQELTTMPSYIPQNSKSYYYCKENGNMYERSYNGQYVVTNDFNIMIKNSQIYKELEQTKNEKKQIEAKDAENNIKEENINLNEIKETIEYISKHIYNLNFKTNEIINVFNAKLLPEDIHTRYNPDKITNNEEGVDENAK